jgi:hypothetical protein
MTWAVIRPLRQPSALSVPNSRTRRPTAATVSRLATATEPSSASPASQVPRLLASCAVVFSDPATLLARLAELVTVADGSSREIAPVTAATSAALAACT